MPWSIVQDIGSTDDAISCWSESLGLFIVMTDDDIWTSPDGVAWSSIPNPIETGSQHFAGNYGVMGLDDSGPLMMAGTRHSGAPKGNGIFASSDGVSWSVVALSDLGFTVTAFGDGSGWVGFGNSNTFADSYSSFSADGSSWSAEALLPGGAFDIWGAAYSPGLGIWVAGGDGFATHGLTGAASIIMGDGTTWAIAPNVMDGGIVYQPVWSDALGKFFAAGSSLDTTVQVVSSVDGTTWVDAAGPIFGPIQSFGPEALSALVARDEVWVGGYGNLAPGSVFRSANGTDWTNDDCIIDPAEDQINSIAYSPSLDALIVVTVFSIALRTFPMGYTINANV